MDKIGQSGLVMRLEERATELNNLAIQAGKDIDNARIIEMIIDIIDNRRYSYLYALLKGKVFCKRKDGE